MISVRLKKEYLFSPKTNQLLDYKKGLIFLIKSAYCFDDMINNEIIF